MYDKTRYPVTLTSTSVPQGWIGSGDFFTSPAGDIWLLLARDESLLTFGKLIEGINDDAWVF